MENKLPPIQFHLGQRSLLIDVYHNDPIEGAKLLQATVSAIREHTEFDIFGIRMKELEEEEEIAPKKTFLRGDIAKKRYGK